MHARTYDAHAHARICYARRTHVVFSIGWYMLLVQSRIGRILLSSLSLALSPLSTKGVQHFQTRKSPLPLCVTLAALPAYRACDLLQFSESGTLRFPSSSFVLFIGDCVPPPELTSFRPILLILPPPPLLLGCCFLHPFLLIVRLSPSIAIQ
jgi:hypothetical protein